MISQSAICKMIWWASPCCGGIHMKCCENFERIGFWPWKWWAFHTSTQCSLQITVSHDLVGLTISCGGNSVYIVFMELLVRLGFGLRTSCVYSEPYDVGMMSNLGLNWWAFVTSIWLTWFVVYPIIQSAICKILLVPWFGGLRHLLRGNSCVCCVWSSIGFVFGLRNQDVQCRSELVRVCYVSLTCLCQLCCWVNKGITPDFVHFLGCRCHRCISLLWKGTSSTILEVKFSCSQQTPLLLIS